MNANDLDKQIELLKNGDLLRENDIKILCARAREIFVEESNVQRIDCPVTICGDIHGQFYDLLELFKVGGNCPDVNYLFLGDFVNRGHHSIESILLLYALKVKYPDRITLLRGNHESRVVTQVFGLYDECLRKYGSLNVWRYITETFEYLTLSALIDDKIFCTHGGIAADIKNLDDIRCLDRVKEIPSQGRQHNQSQEYHFIRNKLFFQQFKGKCVNFYGMILMKKIMDLKRIKEEQGKLLDRTYLNHLCIKITQINWFALTNQLWKVIARFGITVVALQFGLRQIIVTDVVIWHHQWKQNQQVTLPNLRHLMQQLSSLRVQAKRYLLIFLITFYERIKFNCEQIKYNYKYYYFCLCSQLYKLVSNYLFYLFYDQTLTIIYQQVC